MLPRSILSEMAMRSIRLGLMPMGLAVAMALLLTGCQDKLTHENFGQIRQNVSTRPIVTGLIGEPDDRLANRWSYERPDKHLFVFIDFDEDGYVSRKQWIDAMSAEWEDTKPMEGDQDFRESTRIDRGSR